METQPARGMRDFLPEDVRRRDYVTGIIREVYDRYGFEPLETPAAENIETLQGKYGDEGSKLIFKILKRGEHEASGQADLALRYDLTVPLARVVAEHREKLPKIFKRYQIQPVWRAERPARGRYREFYQCDIDTIGSTSPVVEAEQLAAVSDILETLKFTDFKIRLNHRGVLSGMLSTSGVPEPLYGEVLTALDKRDKIGEEGVRLELGNRGLDSSAIDRLLATTAFLPNSLDPLDELDSLQAAIGSDSRAADAIDNLRQIIRLSPQRGFIQLDKSLARGLSYYTGAIMEINVRDLPGSLGGGGRYDNLVGMFSGGDLPACGFSLGLERILVVMQERNMFPESVKDASIDVIVAAMEPDAQPKVMEIAGQLRRLGHLRIDVFPDVVKKMDRLFRHADQRKARFLAILGSREIESGTVSVRDISTKTSEPIAWTDLGSWADRVREQRQPKTDN